MQTMYTVEAKVFNMDFWTETLKHDDVEFRRVEGYKEVRKKIMAEKRAYQTGVVTVRIPDQITDQKEANQYASSLFRKYAALLKFAHNHEVFFSGYACYKHVGERRELKQRTHIGRRLGGKVTGGPNIYPYGLQEFIVATSPLIQDEKFIDETGIYWALRWYNESQIYLSGIETKFPALWISLEILANTYSRTNPKVFVLAENEWGRLMEKFVEILEKLEISKEKADKLLGALGNIKSGPIVDKVNYLLEELGFRQYCSEIPDLNKMRNDILHGRRLKYDSQPSPINQMRKLERLLTKLILKVLNFYDRTNLIRASILEEDLLAGA